jgi:hypothetical protein
MAFLVALSMLINDFFWIDIFDFLRVVRNFDFFAGLTVR